MAPPSLDLKEVVKELRVRSMTVEELAMFCGVATVRTSHRVLKRLKEEGFEVARFGDRGNYRYRILEGSDEDFFSRA